MEESDAEDDLCRLTNLKPIKKKKHRFGLPVWHIPWPVNLQVSQQKLLSVGFNVAIASPFPTDLEARSANRRQRSWKTSSSVALQTHWPIMQECLLIMCGKCTSHWGFVWEVSEDQRKQRQNLSVTDGMVYGVLKKASELAMLKDCVLLLKLAFAA